VDAFLVGGANSSYNKNFEHFLKFASACKILAYQHRILSS
jgi:hypothetical protein